MANKTREKQFLRWPLYKQSYIRAFTKMLEAREEAGLHSYEAFGQNGKDVFNWWMEYDILPGQISFEDVTDE